MTSRFAIAKQHIVDDLDNIVPELFGSGMKSTIRHRDRWAVVNRWRGGAKIDQMSVWRQGGRRGAFKDYAGTAKGDAVDLVAYGLTGDLTAESRMTALEWAEARFGLRDMAPEKRQQLAAETEKRQRAIAAEDERRGKALRDRARKFFFSCEAEIRATPVELYLQARGIGLNDVPNLAPALRFHPACDYWMGQARDGEGNKLGDAPRFPAMVAMMISAEGQLGACHYTFLEPDGGRKLDTGARGYVDRDGRPLSAKAMFPASFGLFIPLTYGPSGLRARDAAQRGLTDWWGWTEGIEDGLSAAVLNRELRMHAASSLGHLMGIPDHPAKRGDLIFKDNDWNNPTANAQFERALARVAGFGKPVKALAMPAAWGKDVNDALRGAAGGQ